MVIAFIPVRGGSKSIPLKNIKDFCGKPLVYWCIRALEKSLYVDKIVVATDSDIIENVVISFRFSKVDIYRREERNALDTSSTESVMLEYLNKNEYLQSDIFMLVQATSPLTETIHFDEAIISYENGKFDSMLSCVRNYRFFWNSNGTSNNYDYKNRPRRQNFKGQLMENGAFYINKISNILKVKNRLSGEIGIYEMPQYTSAEIDEPDDWIILEELMYKHVLSKKQQINKIRLFISDVDGVLTDGGMYYSEKGDELKKFNTRDGMGFELLRKAGIKTGIITSENTNIVKNRAIKLKVDYLYQNKRNSEKLSTIYEICNKEKFSIENVAYIGDDINCKQVLEAVGVKACPADALDEIKSVKGINILTRNGGEGCAREFIELILNEYGFCQ